MSLSGLRSQQRQTLIVIVRDILRQVDPAILISLDGVQDALLMTLWYILFLTFPK